MHDGTVKQLAKLFTEVANTPDIAKSVRNQYFLGFPDFGADPRPIHIIPEIRDFMSNIDHECPHLAYFLQSNPAMGHIHFYLLCLVHHDNTVDKNQAAIAP